MSVSSFVDTKSTLGNRRKHTHIHIHSQDQCQPLLCGSYNNKLGVSLIHCIPEPYGLIEQTRKITLNIAFEAGHRVWGNQAGSQKWLPTPHMSN